MRQGRWLLLPLMAAVAALAACTHTQRTPYRVQGALPPGTGQPVSGPDAGRTLYARDCAWCHGATGTGTNVAPSLIGVGAAGVDFYLSTGRMPLVSPGARVRRAEPAYTVDEIAAITDYVASLGAGPAIPDLTHASELARGAQLYEQNCAACHGSTAVGGALTSGVEAPSLLPDTRTQIAEAIRIGPGTMPVFDQGTIRDEDVAAIANYVAELQGPQEHGGLSLGRIGPIAEGAVGWLVGLGALLLFCRFIGKRANQ
jgi:ubiquinol-cytochrome c reductase cytochrome c subunit